MDGLLVLVSVGLSAFAFGLSYDFLRGLIELAADRRRQASLAAAWDPRLARLTLVASGRVAYLPPTKLTDMTGA